MNRRLAGDETGRMGPLQAAIEEAGLNLSHVQIHPLDNRSPLPDYAHPDRLRDTTAMEQTLKPESKAWGAPCYLTQADVLQVIGPARSARSDSFVIRAYGDALDPAGNVLSRAWCGATLQRLPTPGESGYDRTRARGCRRVRGSRAALPRRLPPLARRSRNLMRDMRFMIHRFLFAFALMCLVPVVGEPEKKPPRDPAAARQVRFLPVGDMPPYRQEIRDGVAYELEPPPGSIPPREIAVGFGEEKAAAVPLLLGRMSQPLAAAAGAGPALLRQRGAADDSEPWLRIDRPETGDFLVLLWRDAGKGDWFAARSLVLSDSPQAAPAGQVRVVNVSPVTVGVVFAGERIRLEPGKSYQRAVTLGKDTPFQLGAVDAGGELRRFHAGSVFQNPGERSLVVVYRAEGIQPRRPLKAVVHREPVK